MAEPIYFKLRIPHHMHEELKASAIANGRSMTTEILRRLMGSTQSTSEPPLSERVERLERALDDLTKLIGGGL
jgi:hypothetical protein